MRVVQKLTMLFVGVIFAASLFVGSASAAGSVTFTTEGVSSVQTGTEFTVVVYLNPSGASFLNGQLTVNFTSGLVVQRFNATSNFNTSVVSGCASGSTTCLLHFYTMSGVSSKQAIGTITLKANGGAGTQGGIHLTEALADDTGESPMATNASGNNVVSRMISITAPPAPPTNPSTNPPSPGSSGSSGNQNTITTNPNTRNPIENPSSENTVTVPDPDTGEPIEVPEDELGLLASEQPLAPADEMATTTIQQVAGLRRAIALIGVTFAVVAVLAAVRLFLVQNARGRALNRHVVPTGTVMKGSGGDAPTLRGTTGAGSTSQDKPAVNAQGGTVQNEPTIIKPQR